jgi:hypothetical protein
LVALKTVMAQVVEESEGFTVQLGVRVEKPEVVALVVEQDTEEGMTGKTAVANWNLISVTVAALVVLVGTNVNE